MFLSITRVFSMCLGKMTWISDKEGLNFYRIMTWVSFANTKKDNVVLDGLSQSSIVSVAQVKYEKKDLVHDVHRLARFGVHLVYSTRVDSWSIIILNNLCNRHELQTIP